MNKKDKSIQLAYLLRHDKSYKFDSNGWRTVDDLIQNHGFDKTLLEDIVATDNKGRYEYNEEHTLIRARQGHSICVDVELTEQVPPSILYHGTASRFYDAIMQVGILKMSRQYVHLSKDESTAISVGSRHGTPIVLKIDAEQMSNDGIKFYLSRNGVWLTDYVNPKYIFH